MKRAIVIGAGIAGLTAARGLKRGGFDVTVLERARGVGGRCATRRVHDQPVDHGAPFLHGRDDRFTAEVESMRGVKLIAAWPQRVAGHGVPCQPRAFAAREARFAVREGMSRFAKHLAADLNVHLETHVNGIEPAQQPGTAPFQVKTGDGDFAADVVVLAMPTSQAEPLWAMLRTASPMLERSRRLLQLPQAVPCLAVIARYAEDTASPDWEACYPSESRALQAAFVDSAKREAPARLTLVLHARPAFSRAAIAEEPEAWANELLAEVGAAVGDWAAHPTEIQTHRWGYARVQPASELSSPLVFPVGARGWLGFCGDAFHGAGGVEGAYLSGLEVALKIGAVASTEKETNSEAVHG